MPLPRWRPPLRLILFGIRKYVTDTPGVCLLGDSKSQEPEAPIHHTQCGVHLFNKHALDFLCVAGSILAAWGYSYTQNKALTITTFPGYQVLAVSHAAEGNWRPSERP